MLKSEIKISLILFFIYIKNYLFELVFPYNLFISCATFSEHGNNNMAENTKTLYTYMVLITLTNISFSVY